MPFAYSRLFSARNTRILICIYWTIAIATTTYLLKMIDCYNFLKPGSWVFGFKETPTCNFVLWRIEFVKYVVYVGIVAFLDLCSILRVHYMNIRRVRGSQDVLSVQRRRAERNLVYQAALQGIFFLLELVTYFILSPFAGNKWVLYLLTTVSWCLVHGMDGFIVLTFNRDFRRKISNNLGC
ncbi:hypothetical protein PENTCL1PPCAC_14690, partial [Pristionchus entomophagus]